MDLEIGEELREIVEVYLIGAVILFTLSVGGTFLISLFQSRVDLLVPLKALTLYSIASFFILDYVLNKCLNGAKRALILGSAITVQAIISAVFLPHLAYFFSQVQYYSFGQYPLMFKVFPAVSLLFAISGVFVVVYCSVDISVTESLTEN